MIYKCYLPWRGEFGWMLNCFVKKFHADSSPNKIICCKPGHEALFPTASHFFYDWQDVPDNHKAGVYDVTDEDQIMEKVKSNFQTEEIEFIHLSEVGWRNKHDFAKYTFIPKSIHNHNRNMKVDVILCPRKRQIDAHRNWTQDKWQQVANELSNSGITVGVCGARETSFHLQNVGYKSYDYIDVDSDIELINNSKLVIAQDSGLLYLSFMCKRPAFCIDHYQNLGDLHRDPAVVFKALKDAWNNPMILVSEIKQFIMRGNNKLT